MRKLTVFSVFFAVFIALGSVLAEEVDIVKLEKELWADVKNKKWAELKAKLAPGFQDVNQHSARDLKAFLEGAKRYNISDFKLSNFKVTRTGPAIVVTYNSEVAETIDGKHIPKQKAPRASVWIKTDKGWLTILHANCNPLGK